MSDDKKDRPSPDEYSAFKRLLDWIAKVPKAEIEKREREYQQEIKTKRRKAGG